MLTRPVYCCSDGQEAVTLYKAAPPDLVLMDVSMPNKDGLQATRDIRAYEAAYGLPRCPVVALTASALMRTARPANWPILADFWSNPCRAPT